MAYGPDRVAEEEAVEVAEASSRVGTAPVTWVDISGLADISAIRALGETFGLHPLALEDVVHVHQRPKLEVFDEHLFIVARLPHAAPQFHAEQISIVVGENYIITFQEHEGDCFDPVRDRLRAGRGRIRNAGPDYLAYALLDALVDSFFPLLEGLGEAVEQLEQEVLSRPSPDTVGRIHRIKSEFLVLRRSIWPQREMINALMREDTPFVAPETRIYLRDCADHAFQLMDMIEVYRDIASGLVDIYLSSVSTRMNEVMKVLTLIATIFIPLGFLASVFGMNFDRSSPYNMPELGWRYGYPMALGFMAVVAVALLLFFRRRGWIGRQRDDR